MSNPKIKYAKHRNGEIFYPRTVAKAVRFNDGLDLEEKFKNLSNIPSNPDEGITNYPIATEEEAISGISNSVLMTPLRTLQLLRSNGGGGSSLDISYDEENKILSFNTNRDSTSSSERLSKSQVSSLWNLIQKLAFLQPLTEDELNAFKLSWGLSSDGALSDDTILSISATYSGGSVLVGTSLSELTGISVVANLLNGSSSVITNYSLSGEILKGSNTITVSYLDKTTTFVVEGIESSGGSEETPINAELPTDGLLDFFDLRSAEYNNSGSGGSTLVKSTQGNGGLFAWANNIITEQNEYGIKVTRKLIYDKSGGTNTTSLGTSYSVVTLGYTSGTYGYSYSVGFTASNLCIANLVPSYTKTDGTTTKVPQENTKEGRPSGYHMFATVVDGNTMKQYVDNELVRTWNGSDYTDFASWENEYRISNTNNDEGKNTALAVYNRPLTDVELTEIQAFYKTMEVE